MLNAPFVESVAELRALTDAWLPIYKRVRPHESLGRVPPLTLLLRPSSGEQFSFSTVDLTGQLTTGVTKLPRDRRSWHDDAARKSLKILEI